MDYTLMLTAACAAVIMFLFIRVIKGGIPGLLAKTVASIGFMCLGFAGLAQMGAYNSFGIFIMLGLLFGLIGDIVLDLKVIYKESGDIYLNAGMISFGISHIIYFIGVFLLAGFLDPSFALTKPIIICAAVTLPISAGILFSSKFLNVKFGKFFVHALVYTLLLVFMALFSTYLAFNMPELKILAIGFVLFLLSDLVLSTQYFGGKPDDKLLIIVNHLLYYAAQICIASVFFVI
ncbi:MAG: lysoplasmalogenase family protein [Christensenellales bacterium]|jgi:hypothetical protein